MIRIRPIHPEEVPAARRVILTVAYGIYGWEGTLEDSIRHFEESGEFHDMDEVQSVYFEDAGLFLAAFDDARLIGSGGVRRLDADTCELKRFWLLEEYQGKGIGNRIFVQLLDFARRQGYRRMVLQTGPGQQRAQSFYRRQGFVDIPSYNDKQGEINLGRDV